MAEAEAGRQGQLEVEGGSVWYEVLGEDRPGVPLLCLHGGPGMTHDYLEPLGRLADQRPVIFYDQLGGGLSPVAPGTLTWSVERFVEELAQVRQQLAPGRLVIFGNSWGGMLALRYVLDRSPRLEGLILSSAPASVSRWLADANRLRAALPEAVREVLDEHERSGHFACPEYLGAVAEYYRRHLCRLHPWPECVELTFERFGSEVYNSLWGPSEFGPVTGELGSFELLGRLAEVRLPTLVTGGRHDEATPEHMRLVAQAIPGAELETFEHSAHLAFLEEPDAYLSRLRRFLDAIDRHG